MILCAGPNPAWDITYEVPRLVAGRSHRVSPLPRRAGGKAANVARVVRQLGHTSELVVPGGGDNAHAYAADLAGAGVCCSLSPSSGPIRTSVTVIDGRDATVLNEPGPNMSGADWEAFAATVSLRARPATIVVLSGSLPPGAPASAYEELVNRAKHAGARVVLDAGGPALGRALPSRPDLVKPNIHELGELLGRTLNETRDVALAALELVHAGAGSAVVSAGKQGLIAVDGEIVWTVRPTKVVQGNPTGAGDALTAAIAVGLATGDSLEGALPRAAACAAASVRCRQAGTTDPALADELRGSVQVEEYQCLS